MIKARLTGLPSEVDQATQDLNKCFDVLTVSNQNKNRNSKFVRVHIDFELKESKDFATSCREVNKENDNENW